MIFDLVNLSAAKDREVLLYENAANDIDSRYNISGAVKELFPIFLYYSHLKTIFRHIILLYMNNTEAAVYGLLGGMAECLKLFYVR